MIARKLLRKGYTIYIGYVINSEEGKMELSNIPIVREF
jgi:hypothetical protein